MHWMRKLWCYVFLVCSCQAILHSGIPDHLQECYRHGGIPLFTPKRLDVMLELMRKLEKSSKLNLDLALFSSSLLRNLRLDGIQKYTTVENDYILPYRASAFQFHRYKLFMDYFLPNQPLLSAEDILSSEEKCMMHRMLSSTVRSLDRNNEKTSCIMPAQHSLGKIPYSNVGTGFSVTRLHQKCPIEEGVVQTEWGTIAPGVLIAAIASALETRRVQISDILMTEMFSDGVPLSFMTAAKNEWLVTLDDVSNVMVATLAGDLAEVIVHQGPKFGASASRMVIGTLQSWNDTLIPRDHYLYVQNASHPYEIHWHFTDSEILAGIDGLILGDQLKLWAEKMKTLRLSDLIDMYYSNDGVLFDPIVKACNRKSLFPKVFDRQQLYADSVIFAHLLSLHQTKKYIPVKDIRVWADAAVSAFSVYLTDVMNRNHRTCEESTTDSVLDLIVATDSAWDGYMVQQFMSWLSQVLRLGYDNSRTTISVVHGNTGQWIIPPVNNVTGLYNYFKRYDKPWPTRLNVPEVLKTVIEHSLNRTIMDISYNVSAGPRTLILLVSPVDHPSNSEIRKGKSLMISLRTSYFDVFFAYLSQDLSDFDLEHVPKDEFFLSTLTPTMPDVISAVDSALIRGIIPQKIVGTHCPMRKYYDFVQVMYMDSLAPFHGKYYRIHPFYLKERPVVHIIVRNYNQGRIKVCKWRGDDDDRDCQYLIEGEKYDFKVTNPCRLKSTIYDLDCPPINILVAAKTLTKHCEDAGCFLPNQVRFSIKHSGLKCLRLQGSVGPMHKKIQICIILFIELIILNWL